MTEFHDMEFVIQRFETENNIKEDVKLAEESTVIYKQIEAMVKQSKLLNYYQQELNFENVNYSIISDKLEQFSSFHKYWNFIKLWHSQQKVWMLSQFKHLNLKAVKMIEITEQGQELVCNLLQTLNKNSAIYPNVLELEKEVNIFLNYLEIVINLKKEYFNEQHYEMLFSKMYTKKKLPKDNKLNLRQLLDDNLMEYQELI